MFSAASWLLQKIDPRDGSIWQSLRIPSHGQILLQRRVERRELGVERAAETIHGGNDRKCDAGGDQTVFDGGGATFVLQKTSK